MFVGEFDSCICLITFKNFASWSADPNQIKKIMSSMNLLHIKMLSPPSSNSTLVLGSS